MCTTTTRMTKKMKAESKAVKMLLDQGYSVHNISLAIGEAMTNPGIKIFTRDANRTINGCIFVSKHSDNTITYGYSSRYADDPPMNNRFATTIAAARTRLAPNALLPSKFSSGKRLTAIRILEKRCKAYFQDSTVDFTTLFKLNE
jgi:hypothetical protein